MTDISSELLLCLLFAANLAFEKWRSTRKVQLLVVLPLALLVFASLFGLLPLSGPKALDGFLGLLSAAFVVAWVIIVGKRGPWPQQG